MEAKYLVTRCLKVAIEKRNLKLVTQIKKFIAKFDIKPQDIGLEPNLTSPALNVGQNCEKTVTNRRQQ